MNSFNHYTRKGRSIRAKRVDSPYCMYEVRNSFLGFHIRHLHGEPCLCRQEQGVPTIVWFVGDYLVWDTEKRVWETWEEEDFLRKFEVDGC